MEIKDMTMEQLEERKAAIAAELDAPDADLDALEKEARDINEEIEARKKTENQKKEIRSKVAAGEGDPLKNFSKEERKEMTLEEIRSSKDYINAFANYIKTGDDSECRALLTTNVTGGQVPVPQVVEERIRTAWENTGLMDLVRKTYVRGNVKIGFELSATGAVVHTEGAAAPTEETLTLGVVTMIPESIKKWITISDEAMDMGGEEFLFYVYDELTHQIAKKAVSVLVAKIVAAPAASTATAAGVPVVTASAVTMGLVAQAISLLSDEAANPVIVMNKQTWAAFKGIQYAANYAADPFEGLPVYFCNDLDAVGSASAGDTWLIVGDFGVGALANFPNGEEIQIKMDELSLAEKDLVKFVGREYVALGVVAPNAFVKVAVAQG